MTAVIRVENLGKCYTLRHGGGGGGYRRLSEELIAAVKRPFRRTRSLVENGRGLSPYSEAAGKEGTASLSAGAREDFWALKDVSFDVKRGEVLGIIGRNGAGKSTLLKILSRITEPTEGRARIRGRVASLLEVGTGFHPELTGRENIYLNGAILGMSRSEIRRKFDEIVAFADVEKFLDTPVKRFSSGMYVRLAFAVAAHLEPEILVVDEVLAVGDETFQKKCIGKMSDVADGGRTVLFVSHNLPAVQSLCDTAILIEAGRTSEMGPTATVVAKYRGSVLEAGRSEGLELGKELVLRRLSLTPSRIPSGAPLIFEVELVPRMSLTIRELALLIYSEFGPRVAVIDLRAKGIRDVGLDDKSLTIQGTISAVPFVDAQYHVGLYLRTDEYHGNYLDIAAFSVYGDHNNKNCFAPYAAIHRGIVDLDFDAVAVERP